MRIKEWEAVKGQLPYLRFMAAERLRRGLSLPLRFHIIMLNKRHTQQIKQQYKDDRRSQKQFIIERPVRIVRA